MTGKDIIMRQKELRQLHVIRKVLEKRLKQEEAGELIGLSARQIRRKQKQVQIEGDQGIIHRSRGKPSHNCKAKELKEKAIQLYRDEYWDFGPTLASEKLFERDKIKISDETLRLWLLKSGDWKKRRRVRKHRQWRERKHRFGEMVQMDGSHHDWLEGRGPQLVLMGYIDDATGIALGRFYDYEGTMPAMDSFRCYIEKYGLPLNIYPDKHTTYKSNGKLTVEEELEGKREPKSQFERALDELGVEVIHANSPQAKGRIERLFGTFQDRLIKEMRLAGISSKEEANRFLESYLSIHNQRFSIAPTKEVNLHREIPKGIDLDSIFSIRTKRGLRNDFTIAHNKKLYQVVDHISTKKVVVEERTDGSMLITYNNRSLKYKEISQRPIKPKEPKETYSLRSRRRYTPPANHPWRNYRLNSQIDYYKEKEKEPVLVEV